MAIARTGEGFHAIDEVCTHEGGPLCDGTLVGTMVQCPWHGSRFDVRTGAVEAGPARTPLRTFPVRVEGGRVMVEAPEG
jgi:nitrite reductase/ring-hydroxylating ferredoxin subunit